MGIIAPVPLPNPGVQPTRYTRRERWCLAVASPFAGWRAWLGPPAANAVAVIWLIRIYGR